MRRALIGLLAAALSGCAANQGQYSSISQYAETPSEYHIHAAGRAGEIRQEDRYFVFRAGVDNLYDIATAQLAEARAADPAVRDFARRQLSEASERQRQLTILAQQHLAIDPPSELDRTLAARRDHLAGLSGAAFDHAYLRDRIEQSDRQIASYREEARGGSEPFITGFAGDTLAALERQKHVAMGLVGTASR
jgi:putative membrane protein